MVSSRKALAVLVGVLALCLTVLGIVVAIRDTNGPSVSDAALALHGHAPGTTSIALTIDTGQQYDVTGNVLFNFNTDSFSGDFAIPTVFSTTHVAVIETGGVLYLGIPSFTSVAKKPWVSIHMPGGAPDLFGVAFEMSRPKPDMDFYLTSILGSPVTTHNGPFTTYSYRKNGLSLKGLLGSSLLKLNTSGVTLPTTANVTLSVTLASEGQVAGLSLKVKAGTIRFNVSAQVLSYDKNVRIVAPPASQVTPITKNLTSQLFGSSTSPFGKLLTPQGIASLEQIRVT